LRYCARVATTGPGFLSTMTAMVFKSRLISSDDLSWKETKLDFNLSQWSKHFLGAISK
jgi:hypothetical protein